MRYGAIFFLSVVILTGNPNKINYQKNSLLFCLSSHFTPLHLDGFTRNLSTGIAELDEFVTENEVVEISPWIPFAVESDRDGEIYLNRIYRVRFKEYRDENIVSFKSDLQSLSCVHSVEFEFIRKPYFTPNDPQYGQQWFLPQIGANIAWNNWNPNGGNPPIGNNVLLASVDTGVDWDHVDLRANLWQNLNEDADGDGHTIEYSGGQWILDPGDLNGIDDDNWDNNENTFIDDLIGWDASGWSGIEDNNPQPRQGANNYGTWAHGTHVAGLLASSTNNGTGIASTSFDCKIMSVKVSTGEQSYPYITHGYSGILYAAKAGFYAGSYSIINNSWGGGGYSNYEQSVINICHDTYNAVIFAAAGNGEDDGWGEDYSAHYPASYEHVISVTALGSGDSWNHWATYHESVDLSSPGENIRSSVIGNNYASWDGTSMATPVAASCAGLMRIYYPGITNVQVETMLIASADPVIYDINSESYLSGRLGQGRVDIEKALDAELFPSIEFVDMDITLLDGDDDLVHPGEAIELRTILYNNEIWGEAFGLEGELSVESNAFVIQDHASFGNVAPGEAIINIEDPFIIQFPVGIIPGEIEFTLNLSSNIDDYMEYTNQLNFSITVEEGVSQVEISISYTNGWNLVGLPINGNEMNYMELFPNAIEGTLYGFETNYTPVQSLNPGNGYWLRFAEIGTEIIMGDPLETLTINVNENWNLISGPSVPVSIENIGDEDNILVPGTFYGFFNSYYLAENLIPGEGYWVRSISEGQISFSDGNRNTSHKVFQDRLGSANKITFRNALGSTQTLYFDGDFLNQDYLSFSLPPKPPPGENVFDVRFSNNSKYYSEGNTIELTNPGNYLNIEYDFTNCNSVWKLTCWSLNKEFQLTGNGSISLDGNIEGLVLKKYEFSGVPQSFSLHPAFPNPFNSSTTISYDLPFGTFVTLRIFDLLGTERAVLVNQFMEPGNHKINWESKNISGDIIETGVYFLFIETEYFSETQKLLLIK